MKRTYGQFAGYSTEPDHQYYNISITNSDTKQAQPATFSENRTIPILKEPGQWRCAVVRFNVPLTELPLFVWPNNVAPMMHETKQAPQVFDAVSGVCTTGLDSKAMIMYTMNAVAGSSRIQLLNPITVTGDITLGSNVVTNVNWGANLGQVRAGMYVHSTAAASI